MFPLSLDGKALTWCRLLDNSRLMGLEPIEAGVP